MSSPRSRKGDPPWNKGAKALYTMTHPPMLEKEVAEECDVAQQTVSSWGSGKYVPEDEKKDLLFEKYGIPTGDWAVELPNERPPVRVKVRRRVTKARPKRRRARKQRGRR